MKAVLATGPALANTMSAGVRNRRLECGGGSLNRLSRLRQPVTDGAAGHLPTLQAA